MVGLRTIAEKDLGFILEDGVYGFGWPIGITDPDGVSANLTGFSGDISAMFDPDTGIPVSGQLAHVALRLTSLNAVPFKLPRGIADEALKPWVVTFEDIDGKARTFKIKNSDPDFTLGVVVCILEHYNPIPVPVIFCAVPAFGFVGQYPSKLSIVQTGLSEEVTVTSLAAGGSGGVSPSIVSKSATGNISTETTIKSNTGGNAGLLGPVFGQLAKLTDPFTLSSVALLLSGGGNGQLFDVVSSSFIGSSFSVIYPFTIGLNLDQAGGAATFEFKDGVNDLTGVASVEPTYDSTQFMYSSALLASLGDGDVIVLDQNNGTSAFTLATSSGKPCDYVTETFCLYEEPTIYGSGGTVDSSFMTETGSLSTNTIIMPTPISGVTGIAKSEIEYVNSVSATTSETLEVTFVDADSATPNLITGVRIDPQMGKIFNSFGGAELLSGVTMALGYKIWLNFNLAGGPVAVTYEDSLGNTGPVALDGGAYSAGNNVFYSFKARADTLGGSVVTLGYNTGEKEFFNGSGAGKCTL